MWHGVFRRADSKFWWLFLESDRRKVRTNIPVGRTRDQQMISGGAPSRIHRRMVEPPPEPNVKPDIFFSEWATNTTTT